MGTGHIITVHDCTGKCLAQGHHAHALGGAPNANVWVTAVGAAAVQALALAGQEEVYRIEGNR